MTSRTQVPAVVVGAARPDGDAYAHFGSLLGFTDHGAVAKRLGLVRTAPKPVADDAPELVRWRRRGRALIDDGPSWRSGSRQQQHT